MQAENSPLQPQGAEKRIGVLSDTHDHLPAFLPELFSGVDEIWHLGDVCAPSTLDALIALGKPLHVVRGNCDYHAEWPIALNLERNGTRFLLIHIPPEVPPPGVHVLLHGHTHIPRNEAIPSGTRLLNPGTIGKANKGHPPACALLKIRSDGQIEWDLRVFS